LKLVYLGLGSNLGDRKALLRDALRLLASSDLLLRRVSSLYETEPIGLREQGWFLNLAAEFETLLFPRQLLHRIQSVERELGRKRLMVNGPRTIDIDLLLYSRQIIATEELTVPHPRFRERRFVLAPLAELNPRLRDPVTGKTVAGMLAGLSGQAAHIHGSLED
jgi:2-amino-4-hydroxy-6-hydroxymethyldihydropteridine diphosphokinase